ncbi:MAG: 50S ribosomal protein L17 [Anaerolineales bacterium]|nr:MAG: 50S ribosomal protein L17 [Anaerolineales bacterium]
MRHKISGKKLGRSSAHRNALRKNLIKELFRHERIKTTKAKAQMIRGSAERIITLAKRGNAAGEEKAVHARRLVAGKLAEPEIVKKLFDEIAPRYVDRPGGYTRMLKLGPRNGDAAEMVLLELVEE